jgi:hypothetical protein
MRTPRAFNDLQTTGGVFHTAIVIELGMLDRMISLHIARVANIPAGARLQLR